MWNLASSEKILGVWFSIIYDISIDIVWTSEFCHDIMICEMTIFDKVRYI